MTHLLLDTYTTCRYRWDNLIFMHTHSTSSSTPRNKQIPIRQWTKWNWLLDIRTTGSNQICNTWICLRNIHERYKLIKSLYGPVYNTNVHLKWCFDVLFIRHWNTISWISCIFFIKLYINTSVVKYIFKISHLLLNFIFENVSNSNYCISYISIIN